MESSILCPRPLKPLLYQGKWKSFNRWKSFYTTMKVLVIGGTGNISRRIVSALLNRNHQVTIFNRGQHPDSPPEEVETIIGDRKQRARFEQTMKANIFDVVIDMISFNEEDAASAIRAFEGRIQHFIQCSTVMTYGPPFPRNGINITENDCLNGKSTYALGKIAADNLLLKSYLEDDFPVTILKPSYTYGPGVNVHRQIGGDGSWIDRLRKGKPILSAGDGSNLFQFLSSHDAGEGFAEVIDTKECLGQVYNIVNPDPITWNQWYCSVAKALEVEIRTVPVAQETLVAINAERFKGLADNFGHTQVFDNQKLAKVIPNFQPKTPLVESLLENIEWMDQHNRIPNSDEDLLEDKIISAIRKLPTQI